jgi:mRNA-degrading endonuclease toxin of MazEF toxin-antitoxin module
MSARTELLVEQISTLEEQIKNEHVGSRNIITMKELLVELQKQLASATEALNECKNALLKG